jgi:Flp pilus assembly protein TadB
MARNIAPELIPDQAKAVWGNIDEQLGIIAVLIHNSVISPYTGQLWNGRSVAAAAPPAFAQGLTMAQREAGDLSLPDDEEYLRHANQADQRADLAGATIEDTEKILDDTVEYPPGSRGSGREAISKHDADRELADERERDGDSRHRQREVERFWIILAAVVLTALDVMLMWRPLLNLGTLNSAGALYKWVLALAFAGAQAMSIDLAVHKYRERERANTELRDAVKDYNRTARRGQAQRDLTAVAQAPPPVDELPASDEKLRAAYGWLLTTAIGVGIIAIIRVAFLSRSSGQSIIEATVFGAFVGMFLGALVLLLGSFACRGNRLGERLQAGAAVLADIQSRIQEGGRRVGEARDAARLELTDAEKARAWAADTREWVLGQYWQALLLATGWLGLAKPPVDHTELVAPRGLEIADAATRQVETVTSKLHVIDQWLAGKQVIAKPSTTGAGFALAAGAPSASTGRLVEGPKPGERGGLVPVGYRIDPPPTEPRWLLIVAVIAAIGIAFGAAVIAPTL